MSHGAIKPYEKPPPLDYKSLPRIKISQSVRDNKETPKSVWKHGASLKQKFNKFEVDPDLILKHAPQMQECNENIEKILKEPSSDNCDWQTLYTHPKLMKSYFWKDQGIHKKNQRVEDLKCVLRLSEFNSQASAMFSGQLSALSAKRMNPDFKKPASFRASATQLRGSAQKPATLPKKVN